MSGKPNMEASSSFDFCSSNPLPHPPPGAAVPLIGTAISGDPARLPQDADLARGSRRCEEQAGTG